MRRLTNSLAILLLAIACLGQSGSPLASEHVRRIGNQLMCLCGCGSTLTSCNMLHCHFADPARARIAEMLAAGKTDTEIIDSFVQQHGKRILLQPPKEGFYLVGWIMPFVGLALGLLVVWKVVQYFRRRPAVATRLAEDAVLRKYRERIDSDLETME